MSKGCHHPHTASPGAGCGETVNLCGVCAFRAPMLLAEHTHLYILSLSTATLVLASPGTISKYRSAAPMRPWEGENENTGVAVPTSEREGDTRATRERAQQGSAAEHAKCGHGLSTTAQATRVVRVLVQVVTRPASLYHPSPTGRHPPVQQVRSMVHSHQINAPNATACHILHEPDPEMINPITLMKNTPASPVCWHRQ